uniref:Uncharacterized protein n=1 Tax=Octopus bimaculoides TaxID=37653 RepID=A0A0L8H1C9_OCTBM
MTVPIDINVSVKTYQKLSQYKDLEIEIGKMWNLKTKTIPVVMGALGMIAKGTDCYLAQIPENPKTAEFQKIVLMGTAHILRSSDKHYKMTGIIFTEGDEGTEPLVR